MNVDELIEQMQEGMDSPAPNWHGWEVIRLVLEASGNERPLELARASQIMELRRAFVDSGHDTKDLQPGYIIDALNKAGAYIVMKG